MSYPPPGQGNGPYGQNDPYGGSSNPSSPYGSPGQQPGPYGGSSGQPGPYGDSAGQPGQQPGQYPQPGQYGQPGGVPGPYDAAPGAYQAPGAYAGYGGGYPPVGGQNNALGGWSLGLGIGGIVLTCMWVGWLAAIGAVITGFMARKAVAEGRASNGGMALAGIILGFVGIAATIVLIVLAVIGVAYGDMYNMF
ncbi:DUF4190 domain-containing protein [Ruania alba]|uniref:DUF4190 domain-containing protein n=1 Tax=Ruania alba TaxID=648782 RepID=A0A1H5GKG6_9MICO|nr:DUF4190 domain-containing protein [Ruania alba]SEE16179.1 hypothetical protein SAMN04488554_1681 [Ruania alba]